MGRSSTIGDGRTFKHWRSRAAIVASGLLIAQIFAVSTVHAATGTSVTILYAPTSPIVANTTASFTAHITPFAAGRTISWYVSGGLAGQTRTNANGIASTQLTFGPGGYGIWAVLEPVDNLDRAQSDLFELMVTPDPARLPDKFTVEWLEHPTIGAEGNAAQVSLDRASVTTTRMEITAIDTASGDTLHLRLQPPPGSTLVPGVYRSDSSTLWTTTGCGSGSITDFDILSIERDSRGIPISFAITFAFLCNDAFWPMVGAIRYNTTTPVPRLSLPSGNPVFSSVTEGHAGAPRSFSLTNRGDLPLTLGTIAVQGADAVSFSKSNDTCSGSDIAVGNTCGFDLTFAPSAAGGRYATIAISSDLGLSPLLLPVRGAGLIAEHVSKPTVHGENRYLVPGIRYTAVVSPLPNGNASECLVDGTHVDGSFPDADGVVFCIGSRPAPGDHDLAIRYVGSPFNGEATSPTTSFSVDPTTATTVTTSATSTTANVAVKVTATVDFRGDVTYDGGTLTITDETTAEVVASGPVGPEAPSVAFTRTFAAGPHHMVGVYGGTDGENSSSGSIDVVISPAPPDAIPPTVLAPTARPIGAGSALVAGAVPVRISFSGADAGSGIDHFVLYQSTDGRALAAVAAHLTTSSMTRNLMAGHAYRFAVQAVDHAGNVSGLAVGSTLRLISISQSAAAVRYRGTWATSTSPIWRGGTARYSATEGAIASYKFTGRSIAWLGLKAANRGRARVYVNGVLKATIDLGSPTTLRQRIVWSAYYATSGTRTVTIKVLGTPGRRRVDVDGFIVGT
jgi:hypothetical protein